MSDPSRLKQVLSSVVEDLNKQVGTEQERVCRAWEDLVGEKAAKHSRPLRLKKGTLNVIVDDGNWLFWLNSKKEELFSKLKQDYKIAGVDRIRFRMGQL